MGGFGRVSCEHLIELRELLFEGVKNILGAGELAGLRQQFQALSGFPRARHREIPYRTFQRVRRRFDGLRVAGAQSLREFRPAFWGTPGEIFPQALFNNSPSPSKRASSSASLGPSGVGSTGAAGICAPAGRTGWIGASEAAGTVATVRKTVWIVSASSTGLMGLVIYPSIPAARQRSRSPFIACAVTAMIGMCVPAASFLFADAQRWLAARPSPAFVRPSG